MSVIACPHCDAPADAKAGLCPGCHRPVDERAAQLDKTLKEVLGDRFELVCRLGSGCPSALLIHAGRYARAAPRGPLRSARDSGGGSL